MKEIFIFTLFSLVTEILYSQNDSLILGKWKVVSVSDGNIYFNLKTDSTFILPELKFAYPDTLDQIELISNAKSIYGSVQFHFEKNGMFKQTLDSVFQYSGHYLIIPSKNIIELTTDNSFGEKITEKIKYEIKKGHLYLSFKWDESEFDYVLEKLK